MAWGTPQNFYSYNRKCQSWIEWTQTGNTDMSATFSVTGCARSGDGSGYYYASDFGVQVKLFYRINGGSWIQLGSTTTVLDYGNSVGNITRNVTVNRTTAVQSVEFACDAVSTTGDWPTATAKLSVSVNPLTSYAVTYNANQPAAASGTVGNLPANQTKWYGQPLNLATAQPSLNLYLFKGWNTAADGGGTAYAPGASYTANAALSLYAQWELDYSYPVISGLSVIRCDSAGAATEGGNHARIRFSWAIDTTADNGGNAGDRYTVAAKEIGAATWETLTTQTIGGASGSVDVVVGESLLETKSYDVRIQLTDTHLINDLPCTSTAYSILSQAFVWINVIPEHGIAIGKKASLPDTLDVALALHMSGSVTLDAASKASWLAALGLQTSDWSYLVGSASTLTGNFARWRAKSGWCFVQVEYRSGAGMSSGAPKLIGTIPAGYRPSAVVESSGYLGAGNASPADMWVDTSGKVYIISATAASSKFYGSLSYPLEG